MPATSVHLVWAHPRTDSLTATIVSDVRDELVQLGCTVDELDLYRSGFDPVLGQADEPDWNNLDKQFSKEIRNHADRVDAADHVIAIFPIWWYSLPAILWGYIDRVWNYGIFYGGDRRADTKSILWIGLTGVPQEGYAKHDFDASIGTQLNVGVAEVIGVKSSRVELLYNTLVGLTPETVEHYQTLRHQARSAAREAINAPE